ncbi:MAG: hypothetical protein LBL20_04935 [Treponema sp.]|jgi:hypothetical protein|nr:hypothetical protein [Treponema sp.]
MKKAPVLGMLFGLVFAGFVFGADTYTVQGISGRVDKRGPSGRWAAVSVGDTLSPLTTVNIGINAVLVVEKGGTVTIIRSARQGTLESFLGAGGISVGETALNSSVFVPGSTAPARTGGAAGRLDWAE